MRKIKNNSIVNINVQNHNNQVSNGNKETTRLIKVKFQMHTEISKHRKAL